MDKDRRWANKVANSGVNKVLCSCSVHFPNEVMQLLLTFIINLKVVCVHTILSSGMLGGSYFAWSVLIYKVWTFYPKRSSSNISRSNAKSRVTASIFTDYFCTCLTGEF
jgi:hypothetical protein